MAGSTCPACCSAHATESFRVPDHEYAVDHVADYARCGDCGTLFQQPMPGVDTLSGFYPSGYHSFSANGFIPRMKHRTRVKRLASFLRIPNPVVLDYGCGNGAFISEAAALESAWSFWGFEIAEKPGKSVSADGRVTIVRGHLDDLLAELPPCDLVTMNHVIEHLPDPVGVLAALQARMRDGGILEGQTPAADSFERRIFGNAWSGFHAPRHTVIFSRAGLATALSRARFIDPQVTGAFNPAGIAVSLASATHGNRPGVIRREGPAWLMYLGAATALYPIDRLSGSPGIINYVAMKNGHSTGAQAATA